MSRDSGGIYTKALPSVITGDVIEASWANTSMDDIAVEIQDSLSRSGKGNMAVPLKVVAGTVSAPGLTFVSETNSGFYRSAAGDIRASVGGVESFRYTASGVRIASQDLIMGTAGKGIDFSANAGTAATGAATTLERLVHYEEGTWVPNLWDGTNNSGLGQTYALQEGYFTRIGRVVHFSGAIEMSGIGTLTTSTQCRVGPLPYTSSSSAAVTVGYVIHNIGSSGQGVKAFISGSSNYFLMGRESTTTGSTTLTITQFGASGILYFSGFYFV